MNLYSPRVLPQRWKNISFHVIQSSATLEPCDNSDPTLRKFPSISIFYDFYVDFFYKYFLSRQQERGELSGLDHMHAEKLNYCHD